MLEVGPLYKGTNQGNRGVNVFLVYGPGSGTIFCKFHIKLQNGTIWVQGVEIAINSTSEMVAAISGNGTSLLSFWNRAGWQ